ncbi:hypothetical protein CIB48_g5258 [Xylaria polymorpha]|nr:hypothetical protein CIB48_g5258 [Xylaria polymorpha]
MSLGKTVRVAAVQAAPVSFDLEKSLEKLTRLAAQAAKGGAELIVFPEAFLSAYPWRYAFDATIGAREPRGREWYRRYYDSAVAIPSAAVDSIAEVARTHNVYLQVGIIEKEGGTLYCTALLFGRDGTILLKHRKLVPTAAERLVWGRGAGDGLGVVQTDIGKIGTLICWENYMPAARMALYQQGVEIYLAPTADDLPTWTASMQHIAKEGRCFVVTVNSMTKVSDFPAEYPPFTPEHPDRRPDGEQWQADDIVNHGGSFVAGPLGTRLTEPLWDKEDIVYADLPMSGVIESRLDFDPVGSYSRPDIFTLTVNTKPGGLLITRHGRQPPHQTPQTLVYREYPYPRPKAEQSKMFTATRRYGAHHFPLHLYQQLCGRNGSGTLQSLAHLAWPHPQVGPPEWYDEQCRVFFRDLLVDVALQDNGVDAGSISNLNWEPGFDTIAVHGGQEPEPTNGSRAVPLYQTSAYNFTDAADGAGKFAWSKDGYVYTRMGNPTNTVFETRMTMLEGGVGAVATASGHSAQHELAFNQFRVYLKKFKIEVKWVVGNDPAKFDEAIDENTRAIYIETISNPKHSVPDIPAIAKVAHKHGIPLIIDNTFGMGGYLCQPIRLGADIVTHSATKWIGGHGTSMGGIIIDGGHFDWSASGKFPGFTEPAEGYHGMRGARTVENTQGLAEWLEAHPCVNWVLYPGLKSHPDYELAKKILPKGAGGVLTFGVAGRVEQVRAVVDNLKMTSHLANVGDCKTLIIHPWVTTHQQMPDEEKIKGGVTPDLLRVSLGIEDLEDIKRDFEQAFAAAGLQKADKSGTDPFSKALDLVSGGFMGKLATGAPKPGTDGTIGPASGARIQDWPIQQGS